MNTKTIWNTYSKAIKYFIFSKVKDSVVAEDLLQETFIKVHTRLSQLNDETKLKPWLFSIARYTVLDYFRSQDMVYKLEDEDVIYESKPQEHTEADCLRGIIKELPQKYRRPLFLADIKGIKQREVAKTLNLPLPTVKSQIQRGRKLIAEGFMACCDYKMNEAGYLVGELKEKKDCKVCS